MFAKATGRPVRRPQPRDPRAVLIEADGAIVRRVYRQDRSRQNRKSGRSAIVRASRTAAAPGSRGGAGRADHRSARRDRDRLHEVLHHVLADLAAHVLADAGREPVVEAGPDARFRHFGDERAQVGPAVGDAGRGRAGRSPLPEFPACRTPPRARWPCWRLAMQCAQGYSGCIGVSSIGCQVASRSVAGLPSMSPLRMAVTGRQKS